MSKQGTRYRDLDALRRDMTDAGRSLWLAGLGALAAAQDEAKVLFDDLVSRGEEYEKRRVRPLEEDLDRVGERFKQLGDRVGGQMRDSVSGAMRRMGVASREDLEQLRCGIDELSKKLDRAA
jgi:poly(hydroxyalkanoate) granule-associated protein